MIDFSECTLPCEVTVQAKKAKTDIYQEAVAETTVRIVTNPLEGFGFESDTDTKNFMWYLQYTLPDLKENKGDGKVSYSLVDADSGVFLDEYNRNLHITRAGTVKVKATKEQDSKNHYAAREALFTLTVEWGFQNEDAFSFIKDDEKIEVDEITFVPNQENMYEFIAKSTQSESEVSYKVISQSVPDMVVYNPEEEATSEAQQLTINKPGKVVIEATQKDGPNFWGKTAKLTLVVNKAEQEPLILTTPMESIVYNDARGKKILLGTEGGSGSGALSYQIVSQQLDGQTR